MKSRLIGRLGEGNTEGPVLVFFGGIHGNEKAGVVALEKVFLALQGLQKPIQGHVYGILGNSRALALDQRFVDEDLNRMWTDRRLLQIRNMVPEHRNNEETELSEILAVLEQIRCTHSGPFYFMDLHTTSSKTRPFITVNDALINRRFSKLFPVPVVLGIEEFLQGPLLSYVNHLGYVSLGFEAGQHTARESEVNFEAFIWLCLGFAGCIDESDYNPEKCSRILINATHGVAPFYEVAYRHYIHEGREFAMVAGFSSFQKVTKNTLLAHEDGQELRAKKDGILFMPLYQSQGKDGYFLIRSIPQWALNLSRMVRRAKLDASLVMLPGISWANKSRTSLKVNTRIATFMSRSFFHLFGYRNKTLDRNHMIMFNRERTAKTSMYKNLWWFKGKS